MGRPHSSTTPQSRASTEVSPAGRARDTFLHPESRQEERVAGARKRVSTGSMGCERPPSNTQTWEQKW